MRTAVFYENIVEGAQASGQRLEDVLRGLTDAGMEMLYLRPESWQRDRALLQKLNLPIEGMHCFCDFPGDPGSARYREMIDTAVEAGARNLLIVPGMISTGNSLRDVNHMTDGMRKAVEYGAGKGLPVLMEDYDGLLSPYNSIQGLRMFMTSVPGLQVAFDTGNFVMFHEDEMEALDLFADQIRTVHLKDRSREKRHAEDRECVCADGRTEYACAIGSGYIRIREILSRLKERRYDGNVIIELYAIDPKYAIQDAYESIRWVNENK